MKASVETQFLLIQGKIRGLPVKSRFKKMLLKDLELALIDYQQGNMIGAANWVVTVSDKVYTRNTTNPYSSGIWNSLLLSLNALQQSLARRVEPDIRQGPPGPQGAPGPKGETGSEGLQGPPGAFELPFSGTCPTSGSAFAIKNTGYGPAIVGSSISTTTHEDGVGVRGDGRFTGIYGKTTDNDPHEITFGAVGTTEEILPVPDLIKRTFEGKSGVYGASESHVGVTGFSSSSEGVLGLSSRSAGVSGTSDFRDGVVGLGLISGVNGQSNSGIGVSGTSNNSYGVKGESLADASNSDAVGVWGRGNTSGVSGESSNGTGVSGSSDSGLGVLGVSENGVGVRGSSSSNQGIQGVSTAPVSAFTHSIGVEGEGNLAGVYGRTTGGLVSYGVVGTTDTPLPVSETRFQNSGVYGSTNDGYGVHGYASYGVGIYGSASTIDLFVEHAGMAAIADSDGYAMFALNSDPHGYAGFFNGKVWVGGELTKASGGFKIDHPLDPEHKYLYHSFVESPEMLNVYSGTAVMDDEGKAWVELPEWFEALNTDYRYQLTPIGPVDSTPYIAEKIRDNRFQIAGGTPNGEICWQVTGVRQDAYAVAHPIPVEEDKPAEERGMYLYPEEHGKDVEKGIQWSKSKVKGVPPGDVDEGG